MIRQETMRINSHQENRGLRVAAYIRISTDSSDQENSYEIQEQHFRGMLSGNPDWMPAGIYSDYGISGTDREKRTGFRRMLRHCGEGKIDRIFCKSISRFARNTADFMIVLKILKEHHVTVYFEKECLDTSSEASTFILTTLGAIAQEESRSISENIRWGMAKRFPRGDVRNQKLYGYRYSGKMVVNKSGYQYREIEIVEEEAKIVRRIFEQVAAGERYVSIARMLNQEKIPAPECSGRERGAHPGKGRLRNGIQEGWTARHISQMVHLERYVGDVLAQKTYTADFLTHRVRLNKGELQQYRIRNHHPAIVDRKLYEKAMEVVKENGTIYGGRWKKRRPRAFSGRLICGQCGRFYHVRNTHRYPIWFCPSSTLNNGMDVCQSERIYEEQILLMLQKAVLERFGTAEGGGMARLCSRMESVQYQDGMEEERAFLGKQISAVSLGNERRRKQIALLRQDEKDEMEREQSRLLEGEAEEKALRLRCAAMEEYWEELEADYSCRERTIGWLRGLSSGKNGMDEFLNSLTDDCARSLFLSVRIDSPFRFSVRWFDGVRTEVEMETNVEDHRRHRSS